MEQSVSLKPKSFFRVMLRTQIEDGVLWLPKKFLERYGGELSNSITLEGPDGSKWSTELIRQDEEVSLRNGWRKFVTFYSIQLGYFLIFQYKGDSHFRVMIHDLSTTEVEYPCAAGNTQEARITGEGCNETGVKPSTRQGPKKKKATGSTGTRSKPAEIPQEDTTSGSTRRRSPRLHAFTIKISKTHITRHYLILPKSFSESWQLKSRQRIKVEGPGEQTWSMNYWYASYAGRHFPKFCRGWHTFVENNVLQVGDVCEFGVVDAKDFTLKVNITRSEN